MAITAMDSALFAIRRGWNGTLGRYFKYDIYGVMLFGIRITPKRTADILKESNGGEFSKMQKHYYDIRLIFDSYYVFLPRISLFLNSE